MSRTVLFNGQKFFYNGKDYFRNSRGQLLHIVMWVDAYGPIPKGYEVHHKDLDKLHNELSNFKLLTRKEHLALHGVRGWAAWSPEKRSAAMRKNWRGRQPQQRTCDYCGGAYASTSTCSRWCSDKCRNAARYHGLTGRAAS